VVQFVLQLFDRPTPARRAWARARLAEPEWLLFERLSPAEQAHALRVARKAVSIARAAGIPESDERALVTAALLHDVGKCGAVGLLDKVAIVLLSRFVPRLARALKERGESKARSTKAFRGGLAMAFYYHAIHAERGAEMAERAGTSPRATFLIRSHHAPDGGEDELLEILRRADRGS